MQFESKYAAGIADGSIDLTFRRWKRPQVTAGNTYRTAAGRLVVESVRTVAASEISDQVARRAGYADARTLVDDLRGTVDLPIYRVEFRTAQGEDPRDLLAADTTMSRVERDVLTQKLARLDRASATGAWATSLRS